MAQKQFLDQMAPYARAASQQTGVPVSLILAQWGIESAWGTSKGFRTRNNVGGISYGSPTPPSWSNAIRMEPRPANEGGYYMVYGNLDGYVKDYVTVMKNKRYDGVRAAAKTEGLVDDARAMGVSGYAAGQYKGAGGVPGDSLIATIRANELWKYDQGGTVASLDGTAKLKDLYSNGSGEVAVGTNKNLPYVILLGGAAVLMMGMLSD